MPVAEISAFSRADRSTTVMRRAILLAPVCILSALIQSSSMTQGDDDPTAAPATQIETPAGRVTVTPAPGGSVEAALKSALQSWAEQNVPHWIAQLSSADFRERRHAADALNAVGLPAVGPLEKAANGNDTEAALGALSILTQLFGSSETEISDAAYDALHRLSASSNTQVAARVPRTLEGIERSKLEALGAEISFNERDSTYRVTVDQKWIGGDAGLERLSELPRIVQLSIGHCDVTDAGLEWLTHLEDLRELYLSFAAISVAGLSRLVECPALEVLAIPPQVATDEGLQIIARMPHLKRLELTNVYEFDGAGLRHLAGHPALTSLRLDTTGVTPENLTHLLAIPNLIGLETPQLQMTDEGMEVIGKLTQLTRLSISNTCVTDAGLVHLRNLKELSYLHLNQNGITDAALENLEELTSLKWVTLGDTFITRSAAQNLMKRVPGLRVGNFEALAEDPLPQKTLSALRTIQSLNGWVTRHNNSRETWVWLGPKWRGTVSDLQYLTQLPSVSHLAIEYAAADDVIPNLEMLSKLEFVRLKDTRISAAAVERLQSSLPNVRITVVPDGR
jgi:hypothetical protein